ncbi:MAG: class I SAM-dependent methyltransferase, partial [Planctomycetota bacterium]
TFGCRVVGVDLTDAYCRLAEALSGRVGLHERTSFRQGSVLDLPFEDGRFDVVWTEHVQMNIADKRRFYGELHRVLKPGGQLAFHDIFAGAADGLHLPVPWATDPSISHLVPVEDVRSLLAELGFDTVRWEDRTAESIAFFRSTLGRVEADGWMPLGLHLLMGEDATTKFTNVMRNLENDRIRVAQAVLARPGG